MLPFKVIIKHNTPDADYATIKKKMVSLIRIDLSKLDASTVLSFAISVMGTAPKDLLERLWTRLSKQVGDNGMFALCEGILSLCCLILRTCYSRSAEWFGSLLQD